MSIIQFLGAQGLNHGNRDELDYDVYINIWIPFMLDTSNDLVIVLLIKSWWLEELDPLHCANVYLVQISDATSRRYIIVRICHGWNFSSFNCRWPNRLWGAGHVLVELRTISFIDLGLNIFIWFNILQYPLIQYSFIPDKVLRDFYQCWQILSDIIYPYQTCGIDKKKKKNAKPHALSIHWLYRRSGNSVVKMLGVDISASATSHATSTFNMADVNV